MLDNILQERLNSQEQKDLYRRRQILSHDPSMVSFCSNDYLGLTKHPDVITAFQKAAEKYGVGSGASSLISGYHAAHQECEEAFAHFLNRDRAILFSNGYMANLGIMQALIKSDDSIYQDKLNHASLIDAGLASKAKLHRFKHKDYNHLQKLLIPQQKGHKFIITDSLFSMDGDIADLPELINISQKNQAVLIVDDAHGVGVLGKTGRGITEYFNISQDDLPVLSCPLGKAFGCFGAIVSGSENVIESLIQFSRSYIYTTGIPPAIAVAATASLEIIQTETWRRERLFKVIKYFKAGAVDRNLIFLPSDSPIQAFIVGSADKTAKLSEALLAKKLFVYAIRPPTVLSNTSRLRITLNCNHQESDIDFLLDSLREAYEKN